MVSDREKISLAFYSDYPENAGVWGYADYTGKEIIKPQYIYAFDFENGLALVCKGEWTIDKKWDNEYNSGRYWTETELWGMIDKTGKEVVPFIFDEINYYHFESKKYLQAHYGGWKEGKWGIIDFSGEWVVEPIFEDLGYEIYNDDYITFYNEDKWSDPDKIPMGIYSIKEHRVLFEPQFLDIDFLDDGIFNVEVFDDKSGRNKRIIIDINGKVLLDSQYTIINKEGDMYEVYMPGPNEKYLHGLLDKDFKEIIPCKNEISFFGILFDLKMYIYRENDKFGIKNFNNETVISPKYLSIHHICDEFFQVNVDEKLINEGNFGLITLDENIILPMEYMDISIKDDLIIAKNGKGTTLYKIVRK